MFPKSLVAPKGEETEMLTRVEEVGRFRRVQNTLGNDPAKFSSH